MKKKVVSVVLLGIYSFGGIGVMFATGNKEPIVTGIKWSGVMFVDKEGNKTPATNGMTQPAWTTLLVQEWSFATAVFSDNTSMNIWWGTLRSEVNLVWKNAYDAEIKGGDTSIKTDAEVGIYSKAEKELHQPDADSSKNSTEVPVTASDPVNENTEMDTLVEAEKKNAIEDQEAVDIRTAEILKETEKQGSSTKPVWSPEDMTSENFRLDPSFLSPSEKTYKKGTIGNFKDLLANLGKYLLIATTTIAVLSIVVGGLMISTTGPTDRAAKGKTIIMLNIMAIVVALFSYSIIRLVSWIIA